MTGVTIQAEVFAQCVGGYNGDDLLLFKVSHPMTNHEEWSEPVQFRFIRRQGALIELEIRKAAA